EVLFTPWRLSYLQSGGSAPGDPCLFCELRRLPDAEALLVHRGKTAYIVLNRYPYSSGHLMVAPYAHAPNLASLSEEERNELIQLAAVAETILRQEYRPHGFNLGVNLGRSAGAGIVDHLHLHVVPRWEGDTNFFSVLSGTRTVPEDLGVTQ